MKNKGILIVIVIGIILITWFIFFGVENKKSSIDSKSPIKIGWIGPLTGEVAEIGKDALASAQIATDEVNKEGGINGRMLQLVIEDGKCNPKDGANAGNKLMNIDNVSVIMPTCSPELLSIAQQANEKRTILLSSCASAPKITESGDYVFRTYPSDAFQGTFAAEYVYTTLGVKKAAVLAIQNDWGVGLQDAFSKKFKELGGEVVFLEMYQPNSKDFRTQLTKIKESKPDMLYFPGFTQSTVIALKEVKNIGLTIPILGGDAWDDTTIHKEAAAEGIMYTLPKANYHTDWSNKMKAKNAHTTTCAPAAYDNIKILSGIMKKVGTDGEKIKNELYKIKNYSGVNGSITLDQNGDLARAEYDIKIVKNGVAQVK